MAYPTEDMKGFNPAIPDTPDKNWDIARGTGTPRLTSPMGAIKDMAGAALDAVRVTDQTNKNILTDQITAAVDVKREAETAKLQNAYSAVREQAGFQPMQGAAGAPASDRFNILSATDKKEIPGELKNLPGTLGDLDAAKASGKYSPTYLDMQYSALAKDFRTKYPSYREFIDTEFKKITGSDPANAVMSSMRNDLNTFIQSRQAEKQKISNDLRSASNEGIPGAFNVWRDHNAGLIDDVEAVRRMSTFRAQEWQWKQNAGSVADLGNDAKRQQYFADTALPARFYDIASRNLSNLNVRLPRVDSEGKVMQGPDMLGPPVSVMKLIEDASKPNAPQMTAEMWQSVGEAVRQNAVTAEREMRAELSQIPADPATGKPIGNRTWGSMAGDKVEQHITTAKNLHSMLDTALTNSNTGLINSAGNWTIRRGEDALKGLVNRDAAIAMLAAAAKLNPNFASELVQRGLPLDGLQKKSIEAIKLDLMYGNGVNLFQPGSPEAPKTPASGSGKLGETRTPTEAVQTAESLGLTDKVKNAIIHTIDYVTGFFGQTTPTPDDVKVSLVKGAYDPKNRDFLNILADDKIEGNRRIEGKQTVFQLYTNPKMTAEVKRLSESDSNLWASYKNWAENSAFNVLYPQDISRLANMSLTGYGVKYSTVSQRFELKTPTSINPSFPTTMGQDREAKAAVERVNGMLHNLGAIAKAEGKDPNEYVLQLMLHTRGMGPHKIDSLPGKMIDAVGAAFAKPKEEAGE